MVVIGLRRIPERHDAVADVFVDHAAIGRDRRAQRLEIARQAAGQQLGLHGLADAGKALYVAEQHRKLARSPPTPVLSGERMIWRTRSFDT